MCNEFLLGLKNIVKSGPTCRGKFNPAQSTPMGEGVLHASQPGKVGGGVGLMCLTLVTLARLPLKADFPQVSGGMCFSMFSSFHYFIDMFVHLLDILYK